MNKQTIVITKFDLMWLVDTRDYWCVEESIKHFLGLNSDKIDLDNLINSIETMSYNHKYTFYVFLLDFGKQLYLAIAEIKQFINVKLIIGVEIHTIGDTLCIVVIQN